VSSQSASDLHSLNSLLRLVTQASTEQAQAVRKAIEFTLEDADGDGPSALSLDDAARLILNLHRDGMNAPAFEHCDLRTADFDPLFVRESVMVHLRKLAGCPEAILLVTGLRRMVCPPGKRWTSRRRAQYKDVLAYIENLASQHSSPKTRLSLLFL